jgi:hypothetical protein
MENKIKEDGYVGIRIKKELKYKLIERAKQKNRSVSNLCRLILEMGVKDAG